MADFAFAEAAFAFSDCELSVKIGRKMQVSIYKHIRSWLIAEMKEMDFDANNPNEMDMLTIETEAWRLAEIVCKRCEERASESIGSVELFPTMFAENSLGDIVRDTLLDDDGGVLDEVKLEFWQDQFDNLNALIDKAWLGPRARR